MIDAELSSLATGKVHEHTIDAIAIVSMHTDWTLRAMDNAPGLGTNVPVRGEILSENALFRDGPGMLGFCQL